MKDFFKNVFATMLGLFLFGIVMSFMGLMCLIGIIASSSSTTKIEDNSVLVLKLDGSMTEQEEENMMNSLQGISSLSFEGTMKAIKKAKDDDKVAGIYLEAGQFGADLAQAEEIEKALLDFRKSGKWIIAYGENYSTLGYYLASTANKIYLNKEGMIEWSGIGGEKVYYKNLLAKVGIKFVTTKVGKYKSAVEQLTADNISDADREQTQRYLDGWWNTILATVAKNRSLNKDSLNAYADRVITLEAPENMQKYKLVDGLIYNDQIADIVRKQLGIDKEDDINKLTVDDINADDTPVTGEHIAVYYAYGDIVDKASPQSIFQDDRQIVGNDMCKDLEDLAKDDDVKAVVIRVNSGGGSAYASEQIWHQISELKKVKPVVVSMSGAAASGGYYLSSNANWIVADPTTITGSIGIFGLFLDRSELYTKKLGINYAEVKTNRNSVFGASGHPFTPEQLSLLQNNVNRGYMLFKKRVAEGRKMTMEQVENIAQGRVWLGQDAIKLKLVDQLGGLDDAIAKAAKLAKMNDYETASYPSPLSTWEQLLGSYVGGDDLLNGKMQAYLGEFYEPFKIINDAKHMDKVQARMPYIIKIK
ncbi:signal peptide peptidase SppA [Prevotella sp. HMSC077E09]|uniref:signal peptide peptidase SppA n=1 Tax=Prevotella sp. HMSC077E09 TaxID=1739487 RepID=UPI0008A3121E|nr:MULTISPECIES: signal peptide peptidase SppA [unclassified Prevotella]OFO80921.1 signal peptide peptidase SppA [Prevotella sp. HMSC077E08]OFP51801.1 signal peptide peptidase SppA [Prevotella sp. HMSC077E09]